MNKYKSKLLTAYLQLLCFFSQQKTVQGSWYAQNDNGNNNPGLFNNTEPCFCLNGGVMSYICYHNYSCNSNHAVHMTQRQWWVVTILSDLHITALYSLR